jgi:hypothetical protein
MLLLLFLVVVVVVLMILFGFSGGFIELHFGWLDSIFGIVGSIRSDYVIPKHGVLSVIGLWNPMMYIVCFGIVYYPRCVGDAYGDIVSCMIDSGEYPTDGQEQSGREYVHGHGEYRCVQVNDP